MTTEDQFLPFIQFSRVSNDHEQKQTWINLAIVRMSLAHSNNVGTGTNIVTLSLFLLSTTKLWQKGVVILNINCSINAFWNVALSVAKVRSPVRWCERCHVILQNKTNTNNTCNNNCSGNKCSMFANAEYFITANKRCIWETRSNSYSVIFVLILKPTIGLFVVVHMLFVIVRCLFRHSQKWCCSQTP